MATMRINNLGTDRRMSPNGVASVCLGPDIMTTGSQDLLGTVWSSWNGHPGRSSYSIRMLSNYGIAMGFVGDSE